MTKAIPQVKNKSSFKEILKYYLVPSSPVRNPEILQGRSLQLRTIRKALDSKGRHVFIYGDRGVGKTSLAQTAASYFQSSDAEPVIVGCDAGSGFYSLINAILGRLSPNQNSAKNNTSFAVKGDFYGYAAGAIEVNHSSKEQAKLKPNSVDSAVSIIKNAALSHSAEPVVVIDEFDRIVNEKDRALFGDFIKQLSDQDVPIKLIFCGVGESLIELLGEHESCFRYLSSVSLPRLGITPLIDIIRTAASALEVDIGEYYLRRIAVLSDGFPYYAHLIGYELFWNLSEADITSSKVSNHDFNSAVDSAIENVEPQLKRAYDLATKKYKADYEYVLWGMSSHPDLERRSADVYDSVVDVMSQLELEPMSRSTFNTRMNALKKENNGAILTGTRQGWYRFTEPVIRGYCRLKAQQAGVVLEKGHAFD